MFKKRGLVCLVSIFALVFSVSLVSAQTEGIPLQKDVILGAPIYGPEDLPEEITFTLYDAQNGLTPLGAQTFTRGQYTVDFEFSQSNGVTGGSVARVKADFTQALNLKDPSGQTLKPKELWAALEVAGAEVGARTKVSDETLVRLLLNSDASLATYLTLAYEGDDNPLTTIYKSLPLSFSSSDGSSTSLSNYFSSLTESRDFGDTTRWNDAIGTGVWTAGPVGIGTSNPSRLLEINNPSGGAYTKWTDATSGTAWNDGFMMGFSGSADFINYEATDMVFYTDGLPKVYLKNSGNFGIGISNPGRSLDVNGVIRSSNSSGGTSYEWYSTTNSAVEWSSYLTGEDLNFQEEGVGSRLTLKKGGNVGIGTANPTYELAVNGTIRCKELIVDTGWADFVFEPGYKLPPLHEIERYIRSNNHLPGIPTEHEVREKGVSVGNISSKLLQKIEELTLYVIDLKKENDSLRKQFNKMQAKLNVAPEK